MNTYNTNDFSVYRSKNSSFRQNQTIVDVKGYSQERSSSFSLKNRQTNLNNLNDGKVTQIKKMRQ